MRTRQWTQSMVGKLFKHVTLVDLDLRILDLEKPLALCVTEYKAWNCKFCSYFLYIKAHKVQDIEKYCYAQFTRSPKNHKGPQFRCKYMRVFIQARAWATTFLKEQEGE